VDVTEWEPATDAEVAMRNALRTDDQESYFRILAGVDLLLPVSADALAGLAPLGWGTWSTGGRTHVLAFTSPSALQACLADYTGSARRVAYTELAETWPNLEWWLAVNPGLPIEGYLPAWFVAQLSRGDLRLPTRGPGREGSNAPNRIQDLRAAAAMAANAAAQEYAAPASGGPMPGGPMPGGAMSHASGSGGESVAGVSSTGRQAAAPGPGSAYVMPGQGEGIPGQGMPGQGMPGQGMPGQAQPGQGQPGQGQPGQGQPGQGLPVRGGPGQVAPAASAAGGPPAGPVGPGGLPLRTPGAVLPSGLPSRVPATPPGPGGQSGGIPGGQFNGFGNPSVGLAGQPGDGPPQPGGLAAQPRGFAGEPGGSSIQHGGSATPPTSGLPAQGASARAVPAAYRPPTVPPGGSASGGGQLGSPSPSALDALAARSGSTGPATASGGASAVDALGSRSGSGTAAERRPAAGAETLPPIPQPDSPLPTRTPMAQTPPVPAHITPPTEAAAQQSPAAVTAPAESAPGAVDPHAPGGSAHDEDAADQGGLPRRQVTPPSDRPASMAAAAQAFAGSRVPATTQPPAPSQPPTGFPQPALAPPVIPGAGGPSRFSSGPAVPAPAVRPTIPPYNQPPATAHPESAGADPWESRTARPETPRPETGRPDTGRTDIGQSEPGQSDFGRSEPDHSHFGPSEPGQSDFGQSEPGQSEPGSSAAGSSETGPAEDEFVPANEVERDLFHAVDDGSTDAFLSTLLLATVLVPVAHNSRPGSAPGESGFAFRTEEIDGERFLVVFTSRDRLSEHFDEPTRTVGVRFVELIRNWPDPAWSFAVNPTSPIGAKYPGPQVIALASWATEAGLGGDPADAPPAEVSAPLPQRPSEPSGHQTAMQKAVPAEQVDYYLERGYDRVAGFVHRAGEVEHLRTPGELFAALGLLYDSSPYQPDAKEAFVLRWPAYRPSLYRIPYGGQSEQALRAMDGWVIERPPFRGNGFAPGEGKDVIAEFKVDSVRLPHGAQLWRMDADGAERMIAVFDCDAPVWRRVGEQDA
jgi:hypothetical protein